MIFILTFHHRRLSWLRNQKELLNVDAVEQLWKFDKMWDDVISFYIQILKPILNRQLWTIGHHILQLYFVCDHHIDCIHQKCKRCHHMRLWHISRCWNRSKDILRTFICRILTRVWMDRIQTLPMIWFPYSWSQDDCAVKYYLRR